MRAAVLPLALAVAMAGCIGASNVQPSGVLDPVTDLLRPAEQALWHNPQTTPHPAFAFPTLTHPATGPGAPAWWAPIEPLALPAAIAGVEPLAAMGETIPQGAGMSVFGRLAVIPGYGNPSQVVDISDPAEPKVLGEINDETAHRNVDFIAYPSGRLVAIFSTGGAGILPYWDITDPTQPVRLGELKPSSTHKVNVVPGTPIVYNANSDGGGTPVESQGQGFTEIYDLSDPLNPVHVQDFPNGFGCHHIYFWNNPAEDKYRATCAGIQFTQIWDTADPRNPVVLVSVPVHHGRAGLPANWVPSTMFSHFSILNYAGDVLIVGDEMGGGGLPPGCVGRAGLPVADLTTPFGALWFYDVSDEANPSLLGWFSPGHPAASNPPAPGADAVFYSCTAHHGRLVPAEGRDLLAMAFYRAGVVLVDFTDPRMPFLVDQWNDGTNTWEVQYYNGYLFTGDLNRGMDVLTFR